MNVVAGASDCQGLHAILTRDPAEVRPQACFQIRLDERESFFGAEGAVPQ